MKRNDISFIEYHLEKIVLGLAVLFFVVVVWFYVWDSPYVVAVDGQVQVRPDQVKDLVLEQQERLQNKIQRGARSPLPRMPIPDYAVHFQKRVRRPLLSVDRFVPLSNLGLSHLGAEPAVQAGWWTVPTPPAPAHVHVVGGYGVLKNDRELVESFSRQATAAPFKGQSQTRQQMVDAYRKLVGTSIPRDFRYVSVSGVFDVEAWLKLRQESNGIAQDWWQVALALTDVIVERQTFDPSKGIWVAQTMIESLPGAEALRDPLDQWTKKEAQQVVQWIKQWQDEIARASFVPMIDDVAWQEPTVHEPVAMDLPDHVVETGEVKHWKIWGYDLTVRPGATYRYRLRVSLLNPLFQRPQLEGDLYKQYFHVLSVESRSSPWSQPVMIDPKSRFFVVGGAGVEQEATVEVWHVFNGRPRVHEFRVNPGDPLGGVVSMQASGRDIKVYAGVNYLVVDLVDRPVGASIGSKSSLICVNLETGELLERTIDEDRNSPIRARLIGQMSAEGGDIDSAGRSQAAQSQ